METSQPNHQHLEKVYERLVENSPNPLAVVDRDFRYWMVNAAYTRMRRMAAEQILGRTSPEILGQEAFERTRPYLELCFAGEVSRYSDWFVYPQVGPRFMEVNCYPLTGRQGQVEGAVAEMHDATDRKQAEEALRRSEARNQALLAAIPDQLVRIRRDGVYLDVLTPAGFESVLDLAKQAGKNVREVLPPDRAERLLGALEAAFATGQLQSIEYQVPLPDGQTQDREARIAVSGPDEALVLARDITDRKRAERALRESEERYRLHFEQASDVIYSLDADDRVTSISPSVQRLLGYRPEDLIGKHLLETGMLSMEDLPQLAADKARVLAGERPTTEYRIRAKDGSMLWGEISGAPLIKDGRIVGGVIVGRDITQRKLAEEALLRLNAELEERVARRTAALEEANRRLRSLASELLLAEERERHRLAGDLHDYPVQALTLAKMKLSRLHVKSTDAARKRTLAELGELVDQAYGAIRSLTFQLSPPILYDLGLLPALDWLAGDFQDRYHLEITVEDDGQPKVTDESVRVILYRCVRELLLNVVKHAGAHEARIEFRRDNDKLLVTVEDDGKGFDPAAVEADKGRKGFGLFSIRERLTNIGGLLSIRSTAGAGTAVTLESPLQIDGRAAPQVEP